MAYFEIKDDDIDRLTNAIKDFEGDAEQVINDTLANEVNELLRPSIERLIPISNRNKKHARTSAPLTGEIRGNMTLYIHSHKPYHYIYFPDQGLGTSKGQFPHDFMEQGVDNEFDNAVNILIDKLINTINDTF